MPRVQLDLLGPPDLRVDGESVAVETRKAIAVLARVVVDGVQRRDTLDALLWPESDAKRARAALRRTLVALRKALPDDWLAEGDDVALAQPVATDLDLVVDLVGNGHETRDPERLGAADALHRGDFLAGLHFRDADPFEHWRRDAAERVVRRHTRLLERLCRVHIERGDLAAATEAAQRRLAMDPLHEPSHQQLMLLHAWRGDRAAAARQYAACVRVLEEELGVAPLPRTAALDRAIRAGSVEPPPAPSAPRPGPDHEEAPATTVSVTGPSVPFVGRGDELAHLRALHAGAHGDGASVLVLGEAGIGKTRLLDELAARVSGPVVRLAAREDETSLAYAPVTTALGQLGDAIADLDDPVRAELARLAPSAVGLPAPTEPLTSPAARTRLLDACATALCSVLGTEDEPGLLLVDDLDRLDAETRELVGYLARRLAGARLLVVGTARGAGDLPRTDEVVRLGRLSADDVQEIAAARGAADAAEPLYRESEGVPFLVVSYLAARDAGAEDWDLPRDGRELVRSRVEQLGEATRQILSAAAVLGGPQPPEVLERVSGRADEELVEAVEALVAAGLLAVGDDATYALTHDKVRAVVLDDLSLVRRRLLHRRAAEVLAATTPPAAAATLASHLEAAGRDEEAAAAHAVAGRRAAELYANEQAIEHLETALGLGHEDAAEVLLVLGDLLVRTGAYGRAAQHYTRAAARGATTAVVGHRLGALALRRGRDEEALVHLDAALQGDPPLGLRVAVLAELAHARLRVGDLDGAATAATAAVTAAGDGEPGLVARAHNVAGLVARRAGDLATARIRLRTSLEVAVAAEHRAAACNNLALVLAEAGELDEAVAMAGEALEAGRAVADRHREAALLNNLADLLHAHGRTGEALQLQQQAAERFAGVGEAPTTTPEIWQLVDW